MNGYCQTLRCFFGSIPRSDCPSDGYVAVQVFRDGNPIELGHFDTEEEAEQCAADERWRQIGE